MGRKRVVRKHKSVMGQAIKEKMKRIRQHPPNAKQKQKRVNSGKR